MLHRAVMTDSKQKADPYIFDAARHLFGGQNHLRACRFEQIRTPTLTRRTTIAVFRYSCARCGGYKGTGGRYVEFVGTTTPCTTGIYKPLRVNIDRRRQFSHHHCGR